MGNRASVPRLQGLVTVSSLSSTMYHSSSMFGPADGGVSTTMLNEYHTRGASVSAVSAAQTSQIPLANVTEAVFFKDPKSPGFTEATTTDVHTITVTSKIKATSLITATTTILASICPTKPISNAMPSVSSTRLSNTSVGMPKNSSHPAVSPFYDTSLLSGLPEDGASMAKSSISTLSSLPVTELSPYNTSIDSKPTGSGAGSSQSSFPMPVPLSNNVLSASGINASKSRSLATGFSSQNLSSLLPMRKPTPVATERLTGSLRVASVSHSGRRNHATGGGDDALNESDHISPSNGPPKEPTHFARVTGSPQYLTVPPPLNRKPSAPLTKVKDLTTTTTVHTTVLKKHTSTTTVTAFRTSCPTTKASTSTTTSSAACTSATPNPNPPANNTCAENGLLEMSSTLKSPVTLEGCALACLADSSCLSFTFTPDQKTCSTSLYPLVDSAFAGLQASPIYNYDRGCYTCSVG